MTTLTDGRTNGQTETPLAIARYNDARCRNLSPMYVDRRQRLICDDDLLDSPRQHNTACNSCCRDAEVI